MAEVKAAKAPIVRLTGRIEQVRSINTTEGRAFSILVKLPAPDAFSSPATVSVRSRERMGQPGDEFNAEVQVGGYGRTYKAEDEDGRKIDVRTADNTLTVV